MKAEPRFLESNMSEEDLANEQTKRIGLDPKKSRFVKQHQHKEEFEQLVQKTNERTQNYLTEAFELGKQYKELLEDKTISDNKNFLVESKEKEIVGKLIMYAIKVNADQTEQEGMGSVAVLTLLLKCLLHIRDNYNDVVYKCHVLEKNYIKLEEKFNNLSSRISSDDTK